MTEFIRLHQRCMGLAIVKRIAQAHEADLSVVSAPGEGTTIGIALPMREHREVAEPVSRPVESRVAS